MIAPTRSASTTASTEMIALPVAISRSMRVPARGGGTSSAPAARRRRRSPASSAAPVGDARLLDRDVGVESVRRAVGRRRAAGGRSCRGSFCGCSPAIIRPSTSRGVSPGTMPTMRPRYMTMMRSASATTSSSSVETTTTGTPASRVSTMRLWMNSIEPTSTPRVGWAATNRRRSRLSSRASTTFCWLPPESRPTFVVDALGADVELLDLLARRTSARAPQLHVAAP